MNQSSTVRERFEGHLPEYGTLWRALAAADKKKVESEAAAALPASGRTSPQEPTNDNNAVDRDPELRTPLPSQSPSPTRPQRQSTTTSMPSLLPAILSGKAISLRVPQQKNHNDEACGVPGCIGGCAEPIFEDDADTTSNVAAEGDTLSKDDDDDDDDDDVVIVESSSLANAHSKASGEQDDDEDDNEESISASVSSLAISSRPHRSVRRHILSASGWHHHFDSILSSDDSVNDGTTSEEEWIDGDDDDDGDSSDKGRSAAAPSFATPTDGARSKVMARNEAEEEEDDEVIILTDDDDDDDDDDDNGEGNSESISEYVEDSFVVSDGNGSSSSSSDDDVQIVSPTKKINKATVAAPKGKKKSAIQPPREQKTKPKQLKNSVTSFQDVTRTSFARKRKHFTQSTFAEFNTKAFNGSLSSVEVVWSKRLKTTAGLTRLKRIGTSADSMRRIATIELSTKILDNLERLRATLLHEMCHAAGWLVDGVHKPPHGKVFKKWAQISMRRIRDVEVTTTHDYAIRFKFAWKCQNTACGSIIKRHSRSVDPNKHCCGSCKGRLMEIEVPGSKNDTETVGHTPRKKRAPTAFSLFVQQNSKAVRARLMTERGASAVTQPEVMKECGRLWREKKELDKIGGGSKKNSNGSETNDENLPYDLNSAINEMENRLHGLTM
jgi:predicted SprT family Zn-dependent metalloprotease